MGKTFNVTGTCRPDRHYMVDLRDRVTKIRKMVDAGQYFSINRARQYGKTTTLRALADGLRDDYAVIRLDFQTIGSDEFVSGASFVRALAREFGKRIRYRKDIPDSIKEEMDRLADSACESARMADLFDCFTDWCAQSDKPVVLMIDEVDTATNNQVFLDFLAQLRAHYLERDEIPTFQSVILAGVYDVRNLKRKIRQDGEHKTNSPWNTHESNEPSGNKFSLGDCPWDQMVRAPFDIAADFRVDMSFSVSDIEGMLENYEADWHTGMDIREMSQLIYDYTSGYPYLVSRLCMFMDEGVGMPTDKSQAWTKAGFMDALKILLEEKNLLYESLANKLEDYPELKAVLYELLFTGRPIPYTALNQAIEVAEMFGFLKNVEGKAVISNRIFETVLYNLFLSEEYVSSRMYDAGLLDKNQFVVNGHLNVRRVLERFVESFDALYGDADETFLEEAGRRYFMLFLKPIINGVGNCYVEARTRNREGTDLVIDYLGEQFVVELKIWRGNAYHERGERQLSAYLDYFHLKKGYMLSFCFNKNKEVGVKEIVLGDRLLVEALV